MSVGRNSVSTDWGSVLKRWLVSDFVATDTLFQGYFGAKSNLEESKRWQSRGGEIDHPSMRKRPYFHTYWGYKAAFSIAPECVSAWGQMTINAIEQHFGDRRWLAVTRGSTFAQGPKSRAQIAETIRHTARAADVLFMLDPKHRRVSETAWNLLSEAKALQNTDGGWIEFRGGSATSSLWSSVYVFRFLSTLIASTEPRVPDERTDFLRQVEPLIRQTERFLIDHWKQNRWTFDPDMPWQEGASAVAAEVAEFIRERAILEDCYGALRSLVSPSGRLHDDGVSRVAGAPSEVVQALAVAFALKATGRNRIASDSRYQMLASWVTQNLNLNHVSANDIAFAIEVVDLDCPGPMS